MRGRNIFNLRIYGIQYNFLCRFYAELYMSNGLKCVLNDMIKSFSVCLLFQLMKIGCFLFYLVFQENFLLFLLMDFISAYLLGNLIRYYALLCMKCLCCTSTINFIFYLSKDFDPVTAKPTYMGVN